MEHELKFSLAEFSRYSRLSRSTIRYFERLGVLSCDYPDEPVYRYSTKDLARLADAIILKNLGYSSKEIAGFIQEHPMSLERIEEYRSDLDLRIQSLEAQKERLERYADLLKHKDEIWIQDIEPYLLRRNIPLWRANETLYHKEWPTFIPINNGDGWLEGPSFDHPERFRPGRAVPQRYASLISGYGDDLDIVGDCRCLCGVMYGAELNLRIEPEHWQSAFQKLISYATEHDLVITDSAFIPYMFNDNEMVYGLMCLPIKDGSHASKGKHGKKKSKK